MTDYIALGISTLSLLITFFIAWCVAPRAEEAEETHAMGFHYTAPEEDEDGG